MYVHSIKWTRYWTRKKKLYMRLEQFLKASNSGCLKKNVSIRQHSARFRRLIDCYICLFRTVHQKAATISPPQLKLLSNYGRKRRLGGEQPLHQLPL